MNRTRMCLDCSLLLPFVCLQSMHTVDVGCRLHEYVVELRWLEALVDLLHQDGYGSHVRRGS